MNQNDSTAIVEVADHVMGTVNGFMSRTETRDRVEWYVDQYLVRNTNWTIWDFNVELRNQIGDVLLIVPVHMRAIELIGMVRNGDQVQIDMPWQVGETLNPPYLMNLTTNNWVGQPYDETDSKPSSYWPRRITAPMILALFIGVTVAFRSSRLGQSGDIFIWVVTVVGAAIVTGILIFVGWFALGLLAWLFEWLGLMGRQ